MHVPTWATGPLVPVAIALASENNRFGRGRIGRSAAKKPVAASVAR